MSDFNRWLQARLVVHGEPVEVDGAVGAETTAAIRRFQVKAGIPATGVADSATIDALRIVPTSPKKKGEVVGVVSEKMPPWMSEMWRRVGLHEKRDNSALSAWLKIGKWLGDPSKAPWCGDAIETCIVKTLPEEVVPSNPFWAQGWATFGKSVSPMVGAIGVIRWSSTSGHVGIVADFDEKRGRILLLGGNQSDKVGLAWFSLKKFIAFRWPKTYEVRKYPPVNSSGETGTKGATR